MDSLRLLIADDEPVIRLGLRSGLAKIGGTEIVAECATGRQAIESILFEKPDIAFLDVHMPDASGLDVVERVGAEQMPLVVFVTAFDEYAVRAFDLHAVDYLLKPFTQKKLERSLARARERLGQRNQVQSAAQLQALLDPRPGEERLVVHHRGRYEFVAVDSIDWIESASNYIQLHCGAKTHLLSETLSAVEKKLDPRRFIRIHRCRIVNLTRVVAIYPGFDETYDLEIKGGLRLSSGRTFKQAVQTLIGR